MKIQNKKLIQDQKGLIFTSDLLIGIIIFILILGIIANLSDRSNEKILDNVELANLEKLSIETGDYLIKNPGNPEDWENNENFENNLGKIIPGLAIKNKEVKNGQFQDESTNSERILINTVSYEKLIKIKNNYDELINKNIFKNRLKSSIVIYPLNNEINPIICGDDLNNLQSNIITVNRTIQCDFLSKFVIYNFNDFKLKGNSYTKEENCNHDNNPELANHKNTIKSFWLCKNFRIYKNSLENYSYYLLFNEDIEIASSYWTLDNLNQTINKTNKFNKEITELNPYFKNDLGNKTNNIYTVHFRVPKGKINNFNGVLVAIPKNMTKQLISENKLKYSYFTEQNSYFILKTSYK